MTKQRFTSGNVRNPPHKCSKTQQEGCMLLHNYPTTTYLELYFVDVKFKIRSVEVTLFFSDFFRIKDDLNDISYENKLHKK